MKNKTIKQRGIFILPSLLTTLGLFAGCFGLVSAINANYETAAISIFVAMLMDTLDGRVARLTNTQSEFGAEYDSLSDMVAFGVSPALIAFFWNLGDIGKIAWFASFVYIATTALRLARFNAQINNQDKKYFQGLPCPAAAGVIAGFVWAITSLGIDKTNVSFITLLLVIFTGVLMVSNVRYYSFKELNFKDKVPFLLILIIALIIAVISINPSVLLFLIFFIYALSGPIITLLKIRSKKSKKQNL